MNANTLNITHLPDPDFFSQVKKDFHNYSVEERIKKLYDFFNPDEILFTSSFGTNSYYLLYILGKIQPKQKVYFINTGFHFIETLEYKNQLAELFNLEIVDLHPEKKDFKKAHENKLWLNDPDSCCYFNKIKPLEQVKNNFKIWISGLIKNQTPHRSDLQLFDLSNGIIKFYPLFDQDISEIQACSEKYNLPKHPLADQNYESIGCKHCTEKGSGRNGRWIKFEKTECGLHYDTPKILDQSA